MQTDGCQRGEWVKKVKGSKRQKKYTCCYANKSQKKESLVRFRKILGRKEIARAYVSCEVRWVMWSVEGNFTALFLTVRESTKIQWTVYELRKMSLL